MSRKPRGRGRKPRNINPSVASAERSEGRHGEAGQGEAETAQPPPQKAHQKGPAAASPAGPLHAKHGHSFEHFLELGLPRLQGQAHPWTVQRQHLPPLLNQVEDRFWQNPALREGHLPRNGSVGTEIEESASEENEGGCLPPQTANTFLSSGSITSHVTQAETAGDVNSHQDIPQQAMVGCLAKGRWRGRAPHRTG